MRYLESFFWGIIAALSALVFELVILNVLQIFSFPANVLNIQLFFSSVTFIAIAALTEEVLKYLVIVKKIESFFIERKILFGSLLVGLSFSIIEALLIYAQIGPEWKTYYRYIIEIAILHISTAGIIGYFITVGSPRRIKTSVKAVTFAASVHFIFNLLALHRSYFFNYLIFLLLLFLVAINTFNIIRIRKKLAE